MSFDVENFKGRVGSAGFLQTNKYDVTINFEDTAIAGAQIGGLSLARITRDMTDRCISASLPGVAIRAQDINRYGLGVTEKMPFSGNYTEVSLSFLCDKNGSIYNMFYGWLNYIFSTNGNVDDTAVFNRSFYTTEYKDNYAATIDIVVYDNTGRPSLSYRLLKAFPIAMNDVQVSWSDNNNLLKLTGTFTFKEWQLLNNRLAVGGLPQEIPAGQGSPTAVIPLG